MSEAAEESPSRAVLWSELTEARARLGELEAANDTTRRIDIAVGMLMARNRYSEAQARGALQQMSLSSQRMIRDIAEEIIRTA
ncbi:ANTAR domain-containing protein [uncultured Jatrophihabitans sp.]|uniref:ANTAR domain-containing protein n=1 Tax=uncultured Jatrophihabitans sp. TaxID=1610747 RepID=UPI0035C96105